MADHAIPARVVIDAAISAAKRSPCRKSRRGAVVFRQDLIETEIVGYGWNGQPGARACTGDDACRSRCRETCVHAEVRAIRDAISRVISLAHQRQYLIADPDLSDYALLHVKVDHAGTLVAGTGPSCWQCSRDVLDVGLDAVWLYEDPVPGIVSDEAPFAPVWRRYLSAEFHDITNAHRERELAEGASR